MKILRGIFNLISFLVFVFSVTFYVSLNTPFVSRRLIPQLIQKNFKDYRLRSFSLGGQQFVFPNTIVLDQFALILEPVGRPDVNPYELSAGQMTVVVEPVPHFKVRLSGLVSDLLLKAYHGEIKGVVVWNREPSSDTQIKIDVLGTRFAYNKKYLVDWPSLKADVLLEKNEIKELRGHLKIVQVEVSPVKIANIVTDIKGNAKQIVLTNFNADAYDGNVSGDIAVEYLAPFAYNINLNLHKMNFGALEKLNESIFSKFEGSLDGVIALTGSRDQLKTVGMDFSVPGGGKASASLAGYLLEHIPSGTQQRELIDFLLSTDGKIAAEVISLSLKNSRPDQLTGMYKIHSKELNVEVNQSFDLNVDGDITSLIDLGVKLKTVLLFILNPAYKEGV